MIAKERIAHFLSSIALHAKQMEDSTYSLFLIQKGKKKCLAKDYQTAEIRKTINALIKGELFEKIEVIFKKDNLNKPFAIAEMESDKPKVQNNSFDFNGLGLGLAGITNDIQQQGLGAIINAAVNKSVEEKIKENELASHKTKVEEQANLIIKLQEENEQLNQTIYEKEVEIAEIKEMKQSFHFKGINVAEFLGEATGGLLRKYPKALSGFGVDEKKVKEFFSSLEDDTKLIEDVKPKKFEEEEEEKKSELPLEKLETPATETKSDIIKKLSDYLLSIPNDDFALTIEIYNTLQYLDLKRKKLFFEMARDEPKSKKNE